MPLRQHDVQQTQGRPFRIDLSTPTAKSPPSPMERELIVFALRHYGYRMSRVARALGIGRSTLYRKLREYGLDEGLESDAAA